MKSSKVYSLIEFKFTFVRDEIVVVGWMEMQSFAWKTCEIKWNVRVTQQRQQQQQLAAIVTYCKHQQIAVSTPKTTFYDVSRRLHSVHTLYVQLQGFFDRSRNSWIDVVYVDSISICAHQLFVFSVQHFEKHQHFAQMKSIACVLWNAMKIFLLSLHSILRRARRRK